MIAGSRSEVDEICCLLEYYVVYSDNSLPKGCRNVGKALPLHAAQYRRKVQTSLQLFCPEVTCLTNESSASVISQTKGPSALALPNFLRGNYVIIIG